MPDPLCQAKAGAAFRLSGGWSGGKTAAPLAQTGNRLAKFSGRHRG